MIGNIEKDIEEVLNMVEKPEFDKKDTSRRIRTGLKKRT